MVCKQIRSDTKSLYFQEHLHLDLYHCDYYEPVNLLAAFGAWLPLQDKALVRQMRCLHIRVSWNYWEWLSTPGEQNTVIPDTLDSDVFTLKLERSITGEKMEIKAGGQFEPSDAAFLQELLEEMFATRAAFDGEDLLDLAVMIRNLSLKTDNGEGGEEISEGLGLLLSEEDVERQVKNRVRIKDGHWRVVASVEIPRKEVGGIGE